MEDNMTTKQKAHSATDDVLQAFLSEAVERFKPDATVLQQRIDTAIINRDAHSSLVAMSERVSYLAKARGKYSTGDGQRMFSASKLKIQANA